MTGPNAHLVAKIATRPTDPIMITSRQQQADREAQAERDRADHWYDIKITEALAGPTEGRAGWLAFYTDAYAAALDSIDEQWARAATKGIAA